jgi:hypothetical protein
VAHFQVLSLHLRETIYTVGTTPHPTPKFGSGTTLTAKSCHVIGQVKAGSNPCRLLVHKLALRKGFLSALWVSLPISIPPCPTLICCQRLELQAHIGLLYQVTQSRPTPSTTAMMRYDAEKLLNRVTHVRPLIQ